ncbi:putative membrane protein [Scopulibacillus daqui]|uniref:Membrane protein n=2 Tax=Scopulibacillus daqui TaxID=1469162 RepID=A0ABS2Q1W5_9BACL|nr:DUF420 domain-containing protein [Scopulibacillus daqui]MBM7646131.1 putative membrane protein [Scopulibacillus daqui]
MSEKRSMKDRNFAPLIITFSIVVNIIIAVLFFMPKNHKSVPFDLTIFPRLNAIFNSFTFVFLLVALYFILRKNVKMHKRFILAAFTSTALFLISYLIYHSFAPDTHYGGEGILKYIYFFVLITHITLAPIIVVLALFTLTWGFQTKVERHRKWARWTMPLWLYVSLTGVIVYLMISPYYQ